MKHEIDKFELINGSAVIDNRFLIITANESFYRFMGVSTLYSIIDIIHQVDLDDFIDVTNSLRPDAERTMVIRMKRFDNSYRWMLTKIHRLVNNSNAAPGTEVYFEISLSDVMSLEKQRNVLNEEHLACSGLLALEGAIYYFYDCSTGIIKFSSFVDKTPVDISELPLDSWIDMLSQTRPEDSDGYEFIALQNDFKNASGEFFHTVTSSYFSEINEIENLEIRGLTEFSGIYPKRIIGSIRNTDSLGNGYSRHTYEHKKHLELLSFDEVNNYISESVKINPKCEMTIIVMQIDKLESILASVSTQKADELYMLIINTIKEITGYRGVVGEYRKGILYIAIKNTVSDISCRAYIEAIRNKILWESRKFGLSSPLTFSIGVSRRPTNGNTIDLLVKKAMRALDIANEKGHNRFILYIDNVHGDIL